MNEKYDAKKTATKAGFSGGSAAAGSIPAVVVILVIKWVFHKEVSLELAMGIVGALPIVTASAGRGIESALKWWIKMKKLVREEATKK